MSSDLESRKLKPKLPFQSVHARLKFFGVEGQHVHRHPWENKEIFKIILFITCTWTVPEANRIQIQKPLVECVRMILTHFWLTVATMSLKSILEQGLSTEDSGIYVLFVLNLSSLLAISFVFIYRTLLQSLAVQKCNWSPLRLMFSSSFLNMPKIFLLIRANSFWGS